MQMVSLKLSWMLVVGLVGTNSEIFRRLRSG